MREQEKTAREFKIKISKNSRECIEEKKKKWLSTKNTGDQENYRQKNRIVKQLITKERNRRWNFFYVPKLRGTT